jgi:hypothetical protein
MKLPVLAMMTLGLALPPLDGEGFDCYVQSAENRMEARKVFLLAESDTALDEQIVRGRKIQTVPAAGANPHKVDGGLVFDWIGSVFIPGGAVGRTIRMLQDYDHRAQYFPEVMSSSKLLCRAPGADRFRFTMRLKEPAVIDVESDVVWERLDAHRWQCRSYSTQVKEIGKEHRYLLRLYSYWRFAEVEKGVYVEGETVTMSGDFSSFMRTLGSMVGINPEKSLKKSLASIREAVLNPKLEFAAPPAELGQCGAAFHSAGCTVTAR